MTGRAKLLFKGFITNLIFTALLFAFAGRINYIQGWVFLIVNILSTLINYLTIQNNSDLIDERSKPGEGIKGWDKLLLGLSAFTYLIIIIIAGLDSGRFQWTKYFNWITIIIGIILMIGGQIIFFIARSQNNFFSSVVRIQKERGHVVCDRGIYRIVRHPGYLGMIISLSGLPFITTSVWSAIPTLVAIILLFVRTTLEDNTLQTELEGYIDYTRKTRFKLIPLVW